MCIQILQVQLFPNAGAGKQKRLEEAQKEMDMDTQQVPPSRFRQTAQQVHFDVVPGVTDGSRAAKGARGLQGLAEEDFVDK